MTLQTRKSECDQLISTTHTTIKISFFFYTDNHHNNAGGKRESHLKNQSSSQIASPQVEVYTNI